MEKQDNIRQEFDMGGLLYNLKIIGIEEELKLVDELNQKLKEANDLINQITS
ncbi:hypothetical protein Q5O14_07745 [Eubacteriaceae bacterium ES2]|nr:hypothetical protein Q5O14_07745 [Eubacteriaceae bacterium ES2]